jgi:exonuclease III
VSIYAQNVNGLKTKLSKVLMETAGMDDDIFMFTESNLDDSVNDHEFFCDNFVVFRNDRNECNNHLRKKSGGGVLIAVNRSLPSKIVLIDSFTTLEQVCVEIIVGKSKLFLVCVYFPPNSPVSLYRQHIEFMEIICNRASCQDFVICYGDFNLPKLQWEYDDDGSFLYAKNASTEAEISVNDGFLSTGLRQICDIKNRNGRILDLIFSNRCDEMKVQLADPIIKSEGHHEAVNISFENVVANSKTETRKFLNFKKTNFSEVDKELSLVDWSRVLAMTKESFLANEHHLLHDAVSEWFKFLSSETFSEVDEMLWIFLAIFCSSLCRYTPVCSLKRNSSFPPWFDSALVKLCRLKSSLHKKSRNGCPDALLNFKNVRREFKKPHSKCWKRYLRRFNSCEIRRLSSHALH